MKVQIAPPLPDLGNFRVIHANQGEPMRYFGRLLENDPRLKGRVLDVGCGKRSPTFPVIADIVKQFGQHDGVDPSPGIQNHPDLKERWEGEFETAEIPSGEYDAIFSFWTLEHLVAPDPFFQKAFDVLKPGGVLYAFTPHAHHPFAWMVRLVQIINLKRQYQRLLRETANVYPAYYRVNSLRVIRDSAGKAGFSELDFHYVPSTHWDSYFPRGLKWLPHLYDRLIGVRFHRAGQLIALRLEKSGDVAGKSS